MNKGFLGKPNTSAAAKNANIRFVDTKNANKVSKHVDTSAADDLMGTSSVNHSLLM